MSPTVRSQGPAELRLRGAQRGAVEELPQGLPQIYLSFIHVVEHDFRNTAIILLISWCSERILMPHCLGADSSCVGLSARRSSEDISLGIPTNLQGFGWNWARSRGHRIYALGVTAHRRRTGHPGGIQGRWSRGDREVALATANPHSQNLHFWQSRAKKLGDFPLPGETCHWSSESLLRSNPYSKLVTLWIGHKACKPVHTHAYMRIAIHTAWGCPELWFCLFQTSPIRSGVNRRREAFVDYA